MAEFTYNFNGTFYADAGLELRAVLRTVRLETPRGPATARIPQFQVRKDIWADWLHDAVDAAAEALQAADRPLAELIAGGKGGGPLRREMRQSMRAVTGVAFALDGLYAAVKARAGDHPDQRKWSDRKRPPARYVQAFESLRYHLKLTAADTVAVRPLFRNSFKLRDVAVHPTARFRPFEARDDLGDTLVEWHYSVFHSTAARAMLAEAVSACRIMVDALNRSENRKLASWHGSADRDLAEAEAAYAASPLLAGG